MTSATSPATSLVEPIAGFNSALPAALSGFDRADITLIAIGVLVLLVTLWNSRRANNPLWRFSEPRYIDPGPEMLFIPMITYLVGFIGIHAVLGRYFPTQPGAEEGATKGVDFAAVLANNMAMVLGGIACWEVGRRCVRPRNQPFVRGGQSVDRSMLTGLGGALVAMALCPATLYATVWLVEVVRPGFTFPEHQVIDALRDPDRPALLPWAMWIGVAVVTPLAEELFFRGLVQTALGQVFKQRWPAILLAAALFGLAHASQPQVVPAIFVFGVILGVMYERRGSLIGPIVAHALFNAKTLLWETLSAG